MKSDYFFLAVKNLRKRKLRSWLTMVGIFISIATIFVLITLSLGLKNAVNEQFRTLGTDKFFIMPKGQLGAPGAGGAVELTTRDVGIIEKIGGIKAVSYVVVGNAKIEYRGQIKYFQVIGVPMQKAEVFKVIMESSSLSVARGKMLEEGDIGKIMIGSQYSQNIFEKPVIEKEILTINGKDFRVKGVLTSLGNPQDDKNIYLSLEDFKILFNSGERVDEIIVQIESGENLNDIVKRVEKRLRSFRGVKEKMQDFSILTPEELLKSFDIILNVITAFLLGVAGISLLVGGIGIANTMYTSVLERTREVGVMKAIGAKNSDIMWIFLIESGLLGLVGGIIGVILGFSIAKFVEYIATTKMGINLLKISFSIPIAFACIFFSALVGAGSGVFPAISAGKTKVVDALRYE